MALKAYSSKDCRIVLHFWLIIKQIIFTLDVSKLVNWQEIEKSLGFGSVEFSKVSAETETEISVMH